MNSFLEGATEFVSGLGVSIWSGLAPLLSIPELVAIFLALAVARYLQPRLKSRFEKLLPQAPWIGSGSRPAVFLAILFPATWLALQWLMLAGFVAAGANFALLRLTSSLLAAWIIIRVVSSFVGNPALSRFVTWVVWIVAAINAFGQLAPLLRWLDSIGFKSEQINITLLGVLQGAFLTIALLWLAAFAARTLQFRLEKTDALNPSMTALLSNLARVLLIVLAVVFGLQTVGIDLTAFAVFSGALGLGIGLGMQRTIGNLMAGFIMLIDRSIKPGDVIEVVTGDGPTYGEVRTLGSRFVAVRTRSGTETLIPNELLITNPVTNWSFTDKRVRRGVPVGVAYSSDIEKAMELCLQAADNCKRVLKVPKPNCLIRGFGDSSVNLELRIWLMDPEDGVANITSEVYLNIWKLFHENGIEIPFPQRDIHLRSGLPQFAAVAGTSDG